MGVYDAGLAILQLLSPAQWVQTFFILAAAAVLALTVLPSRTRRLLLDYGARGGSRQSAAAAGSDWLENITATVTSWGQIPHSWFAAFYAISLASSAFWAYQFAFQGEILRVIVSTQDASRSEAMGQSLVAVKVAWALMALQGARRLFEQLFVLRSSTSKMWIIHWALGLSFYISMSVAVWIEGSGERAHTFTVKSSARGAKFHSQTTNLVYPKDPSSTNGQNPMTPIALVSRFSQALSCSSSSR